MGRKDAVKLTERTVDALSVERGNRVFWDRDLPGFGVRVHATGRKVYVAQARIPRGLPKRIVIGQHGEVATEDARRKAARIIDGIRQGEVPASSPAREPTVADLAHRFMNSHVEVNNRPATIEVYGLLLDRYILPELGKLPLSSLKRTHAVELHDKYRNTPSQANHMVGILGQMFGLAITWGMTPMRPNPCRSVRRYKVRRRERFLTEDEYARLGRVLFDAKTEGPHMASAVAALRLLLLTGCRKMEIVTLRWDDVDRTASELRVRDARAGPRTVPLTPAVERVLARIPRIEGNPWMIAGQEPGCHLKSLEEAWTRLRARAGLDDVRIRDLRHSFASTALAAGESLTAIARLLGHSSVMTTARYAHLTLDAKKASAG